MSESVRSSFYHNVLCWRDAESRLEGKEGNYLLVQRVRCQGRPLHHLLWCQEQLRVSPGDPKQEWEIYLTNPGRGKAVDNAADVIACSDSFRHPVPPPGPRPADAESSQSSGSANESDEARCFCRSVKTKNKRTLEGHQKSHTYSSFVPFLDRPSEQSLMRVSALNYKITTQYIKFYLLGKGGVKEDVGSEG